MNILKIGFSLTSKIFVPYVSNSIIKLNQNSNLQLIRNSTSFFTRTTAEQLWKGVVSVSNPGRRRGRGKGASKKVVKDLNKGQILGVGRKNMIWPGLNAPILRGSELVERRELPADPEYHARIIKLRDQMEKMAKIKVHPLDRGWSGTRLTGRWIGAPDPVAGEHFIGFDTVVLAMKPIFCMKANFGKTKRMSCLVCTGNKNGVAGFAVGVSKDPRTAVKRAKNKAGQRLIYIPLYDGHTVIHDFYSRFGGSKVFVRKKGKGYGLRAHRALRGACQALGITDIHVKVEGAQANYLNVLRAFFLGLINQKSFQQMADEKKLHVVEMREDQDNFPVVMASPTVPCRTSQQIKSDEILDFNIYVHDGKVKSPNIVKPMYYTRNPGWTTYLKKWHHERFHDKVKTELRAKYGKLESFLTIKERHRIEKKKKKLLEQKIKETEKEVDQETNAQSSG